MKKIVNGNNTTKMYRSAHRRQVHQHACDPYQQTPDAGGHSIIWFSDIYGLLHGAIMRRYRNGRKLPMNNRQRRSNMIITGRTAPMKGAIQGSIRRALPGMIKSQINLKGGT